MTLTYIKCYFILLFFCFFFNTLPCSVIFEWCLVNVLTDLISSQLWNIMRDELILYVPFFNIVSYNRNTFSSSGHKLLYSSSRESSGSSLNHWKTSSLMGVIFNGFTTITKALTYIIQTLVNMLQTFLQKNLAVNN